MADAGKLFEKAEEAIKKRNYGYAIELLQRQLEIDPNHAEARRLVRKAATLRCQEAGSALNPGTAVFKGFGSFLGATLSGFGKKWDQQAVACEKFLADAPHNATVLLKLATALESGGHPDGAAVVYEQVLEADKSNVAAMTKLGDYYRARDNVEAAIKLFQRVLKANPHDPVASKAMRDLEAQRANLAMTEAQSEGEGNYRDLIVKEDDEEEAPRSAARQAGRFRTKEELAEAIAEVQTEIEEKGNTAALQKELGDLLLRKGDWPGAQAAFQAAIGMDPSDSAAKQRLGEVPIKQAETMLQTVMKRLKDDPKDAAMRKKRAELAARLTALKIREWSRRSKESPNDAKIRFELGSHYYEGKKLDEAIACFQKTVNDARLSQDTRLWLGRCFRAKGQYDHAIREFEKARAAASEGTMDKKLMEITYELGRLWEEKGNVDKAKEEFDKIYEVDIEFKDVSRRLKAIGEETQDQEE